MNPIATERSWLFDPSLLKLVHQCRRLIQSEFGVKLHFDEADLEQHLADYASKTRSRHLIHTWETLKRRVPELQTQDEEQNPTPKTYRGQAIMEDQRERKEESFGEEPQHKKRIYRGQVVG
ncbi:MULTISPECIES: hypothetical protein [unclassified Marinobacter]|uniref:hypothetical protein n=1 Tax=unclassified Marinobacter TaxID=83889 RepID=UPI0026E1DBF7|nr:MULTISPECIES: hypothetical protein [unclassified Marinobacter]MDO6444048.1 hypothetical protein [Marinobacter sp. 2_MG-2023]MDO6824041.1 hypothetical protein [Marinobacter sp. 1_MG-2023]